MFTANREIMYLTVAARENVCMYYSFCLNFAEIIRRPFGAQRELNDILLDV